MSDHVGSIDWIELVDNFCAVLGESQLSHFQDCTMQYSLEDNIKLCIVLGSRVGSLIFDTVQCS